MITYYRGVMGSGKSAKLIADVLALGNPRCERALCLLPDFGSKISSRNGLSKAVDGHINKLSNEELKELVSSKLSQFNADRPRGGYPYDDLYIFVDECQFLNEQGLANVKHLNCYFDVKLYGLHDDFLLNRFKGIELLYDAFSYSLLKTENITLPCECGGSEYATVNMRVDNEGKAVVKGSQIFKGKKNYKSVCMKCYCKKLLELLV